MYERRMILTINFDKQHSPFCECRVKTNPCRNSYQQTEHSQAKQQLWDEKRPTLLRPAVTSDSYSEGPWIKVADSAVHNASSFLVFPK